ncbi:sigma-70 family RNA polymerase sigma factor [Muribaculaceae bacterium Isolate-002 (NCI)]|nr:sigma-70 family RNA polymerase sigma factor [Muribaculaceae bacterium Isolate-002 (NCI)]
MTAKEFQTTILPAYGAMAATARRILGDEDIAKDAVQDVMRTLWENRQRLDVMTDGGAYAVRAVRNRCIDICRRGSAAIMTPVEDVADDIADEETDDTGRLELLTKAIENLGESRRTILRLSLSGKSGAEISAVTKINEGTVRQHLSRARKELRNMIVKYEEKER